MVNVTRRALAAAFFQPVNPGAWIPARKAYGDPVTHVIDPAVFSGQRVRLLKNRPWPGLQAKRDDGSYTSGPTGSPWINSNAWAIALERFRAPDAAIWVEAGVPRGRSLGVDDYLMTLADCAASGAKWVIDCPESAWLAVSGAVRFFEKHRDWAGFVSPGIIGVVPGDETEEVMNLMVRHAVPYRLINAPEAGLAAVVVPALAPPWTEFARGGGLVIALETKPAKPAGDHPRWAITSLGKGRLAAWKGGDPVDPYWVAKDARSLLGRAREVLRAYNIHASSVRYTVAADRQRGLVQILNFTGKPLAEETTVWVGHPWKRAKQHEWSGQGTAITVTPAEGGVEISIPRRDFYSAIELS